MPNPSIILSERGMVRSDMIHRTMFMLSGKQRDEIPERVMRRGVLGIAAVGLHLDRMDEIGKLDRILDEENRDVVADEVEIALVRIEFDSKAAHVAGHICHRTTRATSCRENGKDFRFLPFSARNDALVRCGIGLVTSK